MVDEGVVGKSLFALFFLTCIILLFLLDVFLLGSLIMPTRELGKDDEDEL